MLLELRLRLSTRRVPAYGSCAAQARVGRRSVVMSVKYSASPTALPHRRMRPRQPAGQLTRLVVLSGANTPPGAMSRGYR